MQGIPTRSTGQDQQYVSRELQSTSTSYCAMAAVFDLESLRPQKSLKIDVEVSVAYDADGSIASHSNAEVGTSAYRVRVAQLVAVGSAASHGASSIPPH